MRQFNITRSITSREEDSVAMYLDSLNKEHAVSQDEIVALFQQYKAGDMAAYDKIIRANLRFVITIAKRYQNMGLAFADLISEGNIGLVKAVQKYDETSGFNFLTYAVHWIRQSIVLALDNIGTSMRLPGNQRMNVRDIKRVQHDFEQKEYRMPTTEEIADILNVSVDKIRETIVANAECTTDSLDASMGSDDEDDYTLAGTISSGIDNEADNAVNAEALTIEMDAVFAEVLSPREIRILKGLFGIGQPYQTSSDDLGLELGLTGMRVRQIRDEALKKLRKSGATRVLMQYM